MSWTPPFKWPLFTLLGRVVSWREKSQKSVKCFSGLQCGFPSDTFPWCCLNRTHSWPIVRAGKRSDRDVKRANRRGWQTYIMAQHYAVTLLKQETKCPDGHHDTGEMGPSTQISFRSAVSGKITWRKNMRSVEHILSDIDLHRTNECC